MSTTPVQQNDLISAASSENSSDKLKLKLNELKAKFEDFEVKTTNGVDCVQEHCIMLRNQVQLASEILIEQIQQMNEELIGDINKYEKECSSSYDERLEKRSNRFKELLSELKVFHAEELTRCSSEPSQVNDKPADDSLARIDSYLERLGKEDKLLEEIKFNGREIQFRDSKNRLDSKIIGVLNYKELGVKNVEQRKIVINGRQQVISMNNSNVIIGNGFHTVHYSNQDYVDSDDERRSGDGPASSDNTNEQTEETESDETDDDDDDDDDDEDDEETEDSTYNGHQYHHHTEDTDTDTDEEGGNAGFNEAEYFQYNVVQEQYQNSDENGENFQYAVNDYNAETGEGQGENVAFHQYFENQLHLEDHGDNDVEDYYDNSFDNTYLDEYYDNNDQDSYDPDY
jgi:hypothetical protein